MVATPHMLAPGQGIRPAFAPLVLCASAFGTGEGGIDSPIMMAVTVVEHHPAPGRTHAAPFLRHIWGALVPLWERCDQGWFVYAPDGRLTYANHVVTSLLRRRPELGTTALLVSVVPTARRALEQRWAEVRTGSTALAEALLPVVVAGTTCPMHLTMVGVEEPSGRSVIGILRRPIQSSADHDVTLARLEAVLGQVMSELLAVAPDTPSRHEATEPPLSARQREVLELLLVGESASTIAVQLSVSPHTVRNHVKAVFRALDVHSQTELIHLYRRTGPASDG